MKTIAVLSLLAVPPYLFCFISHICMAGHMHHGPYPLYHWINDILWMGCLAGVFVFSLRTRAKRRMWFLFGSALLILLRVPLGSAGGMSVVLEVPLLIVMGVFAVKVLGDPDLYILHPDPQDAHEAGLPTP
jgi:hypothetical protein